ncbi:hypothetical protein [Sunxiuqinia indica]|uniref:hypothetical protein n=1 Tax=Sunxiuqinia indica TaxID=2692584 RepID=UPI001356C170|nr:hypothetical protein [Sunxiuqinia indica]
MKHYLLLIFVTIFIPSSVFSQTIYKGFEYGMSKGEAKREFKKNKDDYTAVDLGNGFVWRTYPQNLLMSGDSLAVVWFTPKGTALGMSHDNVVSYLEFTRAFFELKDYQLFFEPEYWQYPVNFNAKYGLLLSNPDKTIMVQLYPSSAKVGHNTTYFANLKVMNYDWFMSIYKENLNVLDEKSAESGF